MSFVLKPGQGTAFPHDRRGNDKAPHARGTAVAPDGTQLAVSIWKRVSKDGKPWLSISLEEKGRGSKTKPKPEFDDPLDF